MGKRTFDTVGSAPRRRHLNEVLGGPGGACPQLGADTIFPEASRRTYQAILGSEYGFESIRIATSSMIVLIPFGSAVLAAEEWQIEL